MELEELKKQLAEKEIMKERTEVIFHQLNGQIALLRDIIKQEEEKNKEKAPLTIKESEPRQTC